MNIKILQNQLPVNESYKGSGIGFDVGLLSQPPDLFALKFTLPPSEDPDEYFREVGIDDPWIKGLLCSKTTNSVNTDHRPQGIDCTDYENS